MRAVRRAAAWILVLDRSDEFENGITPRNVRDRVASLLRLPGSVVGLDLKDDVRWKALQSLRDPK